MRELVAMAIVGFVACSPDSVEPWRECDAAFAQLHAPRAPRRQASIVPVAVGDPLPIVRITSSDDDPEALANRALASACVLTGGEVSATPELLRWAEAVLAGELFPEVGAPFDEPLLLRSSTSSTVAGDVEVMREHEEQLRAPAPGEVDDGIGPEDAEVAAQALLAELVQRGLAPDVDLPRTHASAWQTTSCTMDGCGHYVHRYSFHYTPHLAGVAVVNSGFRIDIDREGEPIGLWLRAVSIEAAGMTVAVIDHAEAERRFLELAQAQNPILEVSIDTPGRVVYLLPLLDQPDEAAPVWYGAWYGVSANGVISRPQPSWLSLSETDAPLVPYSP